MLALEIQIKIQIRLRWKKRLIGRDIWEGLLGGKKSKLTSRQLKREKLCGQKQESEGKDLSGLVGELGLRFGKWNHLE